MSSDAGRTEAQKPLAAGADQFVPMAACRYECAVTDGEVSGLHRGLFMSSSRPICNTRFSSAPNLCELKTIG
jgi:hypothetical protein